MIRFTAREVADEARREIGQRLRVYGRLVSEGKMKADKADRLIAIMKQIADEYAERAEADEREERLL